MPGDFGKSQLSSLLETVPGLASVLRSPVADAIVHMVRAGAGLHDFDFKDAEELVQYATRRGLIPSAEGALLLEEVKAVSRKRRAKTKRTKKRTVKKTTAKKPAAKKPVARRAGAKKRVAKKAKAKKTATAGKKAAKSSAKKQAGKKTARKAASKGRR